LAVLAALTVAYVLSQFFRTMLGVIAPEVAADLGLAPTALGSLSALFFLAFALAQLPVGILLDRFGPRRTVSLVMLLAVAGAALLAAATGPALAFVGQVLIGLGCAPIYMGALFVVARTYSPVRFAAISSLILAIGQAGVLLGTTPLALAAEALGWRGAVLVVSGIVLVSALVVAAVVRDPPRAAGAGDTLAAGLAGVLSVLRLRALWPILPLCFVSYGVVITLRGLWGGPYLAEVFELAPTPRGHVLLAMSLGLIGGTLAYASIERRLDRRREPVIVGTCLAVAALLLLAAMPGRSLALAAVLLTVVAFLGLHFALVMAQGRRFLPDYLVGRGLTLLNGTAFAGAAVVQLASGAVIDATRASGAGVTGSYAMLFGFLAAVLTVTLFPYLRSSDRRS
jgi:MFS family permease